MTEWVQLPEPYERISTLEGWSLEGPAAYELGPGLYVGGTSNMRARLGDHRRAGMLTAVRSGTVYPCRTTEGALRLEKALIWLKNPTENQDRPKPSGPLWAATLGQLRPISGWSWIPECGHVRLEGHTLADRDGVFIAGCSCRPWDNWLETVQSYVAEREDRELQAMHERFEVEDELNAERQRWEQAECAQCEAHEERIAKLEGMLVKAQEAEWTA